ncbi:hypothetical protein BO83DRAFT_387753 [Aspergillus eucalypticola CBS 122712]|uniref:Thioester reductase (TE) domain-containing protein n=1 Tax=Aspergillus eucalypticola (strain CBS 122712 / IBT 29274) TaxID=1448314 RepID=A0A317VR34_ASPEC|nr:uncharacterized protein BO83DRAFT_387753 [Aspergillus eucalypticola CBS 122712]PWY75741.1 hypothetical protein BO83DRAFT_387753 [Aspergillus eucalypticola CBS 122712]
MPMTWNQSTILEADTSQKELGLPPSIIDNLRHSVTIILHNLWPINLNWAFSSFGPHLVGLVNLFHFCAVAFAPPKLFRVSSIGALLKLHGDSGTLPEQLIQMDQPSVKNYGESIYVGEQLLHYAHDQLSIPISTARLTYTPGTMEHPSRWSHVDWIPVDLLSDIFVDLALSHGFDGARRGNEVECRLQVFHPVNLHSVDWRVVHKIIIEETQTITGQRLKPISLHQWIQQIQIEHDSHVSGSDQPHNQNQEEEGYRTSCGQKMSGLHTAMRMLDFYRDVFASDAIHAFTETEKSAKSSAILRSDPAVQNEWIRKWVREWVEASS